MSTSERRKNVEHEGTVVGLQWKFLIVVLGPGGGKADGSEDVSTGSLLYPADYEHFIVKPAQFHNFTVGTRAKYKVEEGQDGTKTAFDVRHECNDKWQEWERQRLEAIAHPAKETYTRAEWEAIGRQQSEWRAQQDEE